MNIFKKLLLRWLMSGEEQVNEVEGTEGTGTEGTGTEGTGTEGTGTEGTGTEGTGTEGTGTEGTGTEGTASDVVAEVKTDFEKGYEFVKAGVEKFGAEAEADLVEFVKKYL